MAKRGGFFVRLCYGYVGRYKDTSKMTAKEVIEEFLKSKGVSSPSEYFKKRFRRRIFKNPKLPDEILPRSIGAKWANVPVRTFDGMGAKLKEGSKLQNKEVIAGKGHKRRIDDIARLVRENKGTKPQDWQKIKAWGTIVYDDGEEEYVELHWYYAESVGMIEMKVV